MSYKSKRIGTKKTGFLTLTFNELDTIKVQNDFDFYLKLLQEILNHIRTYGDQSDRDQKSRGMILKGIAMIRSDNKSLSDLSKDACNIARPLLLKGRENRTTTVYVFGDTGSSSPVLSNLVRVFGHARIKAKETGFNYHSRVFGGMEYRLRKCLKQEPAPFPSALI